MLAELLKVDIVSNHLMSVYYNAFDRVRGRRARVGAVAGGSGLFQEQRITVAALELGSCYITAKDA